MYVIDTAISAQNGRTHSRVSVTFKRVFSAPAHRCGAFYSYIMHPSNNRWYSRLLTHTPLCMATECIHLITIHSLITNSYTSLHGYRMHPSNNRWYIRLLTHTPLCMATECIHLITIHLLTDSYTSLHGYRMHPSNKNTFAYWLIHFFAWLQNASV